MSRGEIGVLFTVATIVGVMVWAKLTWGPYWVRDAQLPTTALSLVYLLGCGLIDLTIMMVTFTALYLDLLRVRGILTVQQKQHKERAFDLSEPQDTAIATACPAVKAKLTTYARMLRTPAPKDRQAQEDKRCSI